MGTTAQKLQRVLDTKSGLKDTINTYLGQDITEAIPFKDYETYIKNFYKGLPKTDYAEGTEVTLSNTLKGKLDYENNIVGYGDASQDSATGSNLMNTEKIVNGTYNGLTITKDSDDFINISGTASANTAIVLSEITYNFPSELYISYENNFTTNTAQLSFLNGSTTLGGLTFSGANRTYDMSTILGGKTCTRIELYITSGNTINGKFRPMLNTQSGQTYSKYAFPNPSFPSDIEVVTGTQEVKVNNGNIAEVNTSDFTLEDNAISTNKNNGELLFKGVSLKANITYYLKFILLQRPTTATSLSAYIDNVTNNDLSILSFERENRYTLGQLYTTTYTPTKDVTLTTKIWGNANRDTIKFQYWITPDSNMNTYKPFQETTQQLSLGDIETCKIVSDKDCFYRTSGKNVIDWANINYSNVNSASSTRTENEYNVVASDSQWGHVRFTQANLNLKPNTNYVFRARIKSTTNTNGARLRVTPSMNVGEVDMYSNATTTGNVAILSFTTPSTIPSDGAICLYPYAANTNATFSEVMIYEGTDTALPYEPYGTGEWYKHKVINKKIFTGANSEGWVSNRSTTPYVYGITIDDYKRVDEITCIANYFKAVTNGTYGSMASGEIKFRYYTDSVNTLYICTADITSVADFKTWLSTHNLEVYYILANAVEEKITGTLAEQLEALYNAQSNSGTTVVTSDGDLPMILKLRALKGE